MFRARLCAALGIGLMLVSASTEAREIELSVDTRIGGDSNVFRNQADKKSDGFFQLAPKLVVREQNSNLNYNFNYRPTYETYFQTSGIDGFDHRAVGELEWKITPVDTAGFDASFSSLRRVTIDDQTSPLDPTPTLEESDRERLKRSLARVYYTKAVAPRVTLQASSTFDDFDSSRDTTLDSRAFSGQLAAQYAFDPKTGLGTTTSFLHRETGGSDTQYTTDTDIWDVGASVRRAVTQTLDVSVQAGPSFISTTQKPPSGFGLSTRHSSDISYFAAADVEKRWRKSNLKMSYVRSESRGGGTSSTSFLDNVSVTYDHHFNRQWWFRIFGSWSQRKEISATPGQSKDDTTTYYAFFNLTRRISRQLSIIGRYEYSNQDRDGDPTENSVGGVSSGFISLRYTFEPVAF
jgi:hypothetical protein